MRKVPAIVALLCYVAFWAALLTRVPRAAVASPVPAVVTAAPDSVRTVLGWIPVERDAAPEVDGVPVLGAWLWNERRIVLRSNLPAAVAAHTLRHEQCHVTMDAFGLSYLMQDSLQDAVCDAMATAQQMEQR
jgi:hypothetical protein